MRVTSELEDAESLEDLPVGAGGVSAGGARPLGNSAGGGRPGNTSSGGAPGALAVAPPSGPVSLGEIAEVWEVGSDIAGISRTNGEPSLGLNIAKAPDANTVKVARGVEEALDEIREDLGEDEVRVVLDSASDVGESVSGLVEEGLIGAFLAVLVIFAFLRSVRATLVAAVSLPTSVLAALLFSWGYSLTLNILTLAGLTIAVGRVVDDAIVVLEKTPTATSRRATTRRRRPSRGPRRSRAPSPPRRSPPRRYSCLWRSSGGSSASSSSRSP